MLRLTLPCSIDLHVQSSRCLHVLKWEADLEGAWFELTGLTPDTRYPPLCSEASSRTLMGSDIEPEWEMLMADHVGKMLPAVHLILSIGLGGGGCMARVETVVGVSVKSGTNEA